MTDFELYGFILCLIVLLAFTLVFTVTIGWIAILKLKLIREGIDDEKIEDEYLENQSKSTPLALKILSGVFPFVVCVVLVIAFIFSMNMTLNEKEPVGDIPVLKVVTSGSMASKYEGNEYLFENNIDNQLQTFDLILTHKLPGEYDLELYDIVVYEVEGSLVIHRIVGIEEPNSKHPDERHFLLQGDAVQFPDRFPVRYSQMKAIYLGDRTPFIGSFIVFMQSPAGMLCVLLILLTTLIVPLLECIFNRAKKRRLRNLGYYL